MPLDPALKYGACASLFVRRLGLPAALRFVGRFQVLAPVLVVGGVTQVGAVGPVQPLGHLLGRELLAHVEVPGEAAAERVAADGGDDDGFTCPSLTDPTASSLLVVVSVIMTPPALTGDGASYTVSLTDPDTDNE